MLADLVKKKKKQAVAGEMEFSSDGPYFAKGLFTDLSPNAFISQIYVYVYEYLIDGLIKACKYALMRAKGFWNGLGKVLVL
jgi:hypothetical protein